MEACNEYKYFAFLYVGSHIKCRCFDIEHNRALTQYQVADGRCPHNKPEIIPPERVNTSQQYQFLIGTDLKNAPATNLVYAKDMWQAAEVCVDWETKHPETPEEIQDVKLRCKGYQTMIVYGNVYYTSLISLIYNDK